VHVQIARRLRGRYASFTDQLHSLELESSINRLRPIANLRFLRPP
jgi:hypothetical protein